MRRPVVVLALFALLAAPRLPAQGLEPGCDKERTTSFRFGLTGGNLMPSETELTAAGYIRHRTMERVGPVTGRVPRETVLTLARTAWRGGFGALPPAPTHPTKNPDAARQFIELHSACGFHHVEYGPGDESPLFRDIYSQLTRFTAKASRKRP